MIFFTADDVHQFIGKRKLDAAKCGFAGKDVEVECL